MLLQLSQLVDSETIRKFLFSANLFHTTQAFPFIIETKTREKRTPQDGGLVFQTSGSLNLRGLNLPQVANNVRKRLHNLIDTVTNPLNVQVITQTELADENYEYDQQYDYNEQQYQNLPDPPPGPPPRGHPHRHHPRGHRPRGPPPHDHPPGGPPHWHPPGGPPSWHPPEGPPRGPPPRGPPRRPPYEQGPPGPPVGIGEYPGKPFDENTSEENNQNSPEIRPGFDQQPNYPSGGASTVNIDLSASHPTTTSANLDEKSAESNSNIAGYIEDNFPVILLNENEIR